MALHDEIHLFREQNPIHANISLDNERYEWDKKRDGKRHYGMDQLLYEPEIAQYDILCMQLADNIMDYEHIFNNYGLFELHELLTYKQAMNYEPYDPPKRTK